MNFFKKVVYIISVLSFFWFSSFGQGSDITGSVYDKSGQPLSGATVMLVHVNDSVLVKGTSADVNGDFRFEKVANGTYLLKITFIGYRDFFKVLSYTGELFSFGKLELNESTENLGEVNVQGKIPPAQQKGDTTQFNANAYKTNPDANAEELITKMPGVTTQDGKMQAQGEDVKTVLVDGKPFFGDDPNSVLKNIPAEIIEKIQVFDRKSDQSVFTGVDDGNTSKTINIVTRPEFRNGTFGKIFAGYGDQDRYKAGATVNFFKDKRRITILAQSNNINEQNFSMEDLAGVISSQGGGNRPGGSQGNYGGGGPRGQGGGPRGSGGQGNDAGFFLVNQNGGLNLTHALGLNYANQVKKFEIAFSYFFNSTNTNATTDLFRQYSNSSKFEGVSYTETKEAVNTNSNHRANIKIEYKMDSLRSVVIQPKFTVQANSGNSELKGISRLQGFRLSSTESQSDSRHLAYNVSAPLLFRNAFRKKGRTFSVNLTPGYNSYKGRSYIISNVDTPVDSLKVDSLDQYFTLEKRGLNLSTNITYTEPVSEGFLINLIYTNTFNEQHADKETFDKPTDTSGYIDINEFLTNTFTYNYFAQSIGGGFRLQQDKLSFSLNTGFQRAVLKEEYSSPGQGILLQEYFSFLPNAMFMYKFTERKNLRLYYRSSNTPPTVEQTQPVINNSNPLQVSIGNPGLKQDWQHNVNLRYSGVNTEKNSSIFFLVNFSYTKDYIGNSTDIATSLNHVHHNYILQEGAQITQPVNLDEAYTFRVFMNYSFAVAKIKSNVNFNLGAGYSKTPALTNEKLNYTQSTTPVLGLSVTSNISKSIDFLISSSTSLTQSVNTELDQLNSNYLTQASKVKLTVIPWKWLVLQTDITHQFNSGLSQDYNEKFLLWNAGLGYKFLKNQVAELRVSVYDILNQNKSITRNTTESYYEDIKTNVLTRYFILTFTYNLKFFKSKQFGH